MLVVELTLATIEGANRQWGPVLVPCAVVVAVLLWAANRPVRAWQPRVKAPRQGPSLLGGLAVLVGQLVVAGLASRVAALSARRAGALPDAMVLRPPTPWRQAPLDAGRALPGAGTVAAVPAPARPQLAMPEPAKPHSQFYDDYLDGLVPSPHTGRYWPDVRAELLVLHRRLYGPGCQLGIVCGGQAVATELDHCAKAAGYPHDYSMLGQETTETTAAVCHDDHVLREHLKRQHVNAWLLPQARRQWRKP